MSGPRGIMPTQQNAQINLIIDQWLNPSMVTSLVDNRSSYSLVLKTSPKEKVIMVIELFIHIVSACS